MLQLCTIYACANGTLGLNLSRAPWDPYPWVSGVQEKSSAERGGVRMGDTLLELNGADVLGLRISELASRLQDHWQSGAENVTMMMWRQQATNSPNEDPAEAAHAVQHGINQQSLQKFATCLQHISQLLECPVCLEVIKPPGWQCCNGHVLCNNCRSRSVKCPVCRVPLGPRGRCLLSDKLFTLLAESFPCDGGKTNKQPAAQGHDKLSSVNKCTNEYHNQPKMALAKSNSGQKKCGKQISRQLQLQFQLQGVGQTARAPGSVTESHHSPGPAREGRKGQETALLIKVQYQSPETSRPEEVEEEALVVAEAEECNNMLVKPKLKLSKKSWRITGQDQDGLRCNEVATINNGHQTTATATATATTTGMETEGQVNQCQRSGSEFGSQNYHCPTGKSCSYQQKLANKLSTVGLKATAAARGALSTGSHKQAPASGVNQDATGDAAEDAAQDATTGSVVSSINWQQREWQLLSHLSAEHRLAVVHFYGTFGQRLHVPLQMGLACLRLSGEHAAEASDTLPVVVHTFFLAVIEIGGDEHAVFLWHLDQPGQSQSPLYETVIEAQCGAVRWFGPVQSLRRSWPEIRESGGFLRCSNLALDSGVPFKVTVKSSRSPVAQ
ncbi:hypothetical protein KR018_003766 [Drosophila ironensis]|nr:hypothetical protein KR018_003766 [Drosophila ironensis]